MSNLEQKNDLSELNPAQREAVCYEGELPIMVLAGPGSGKTHVITQRIRYLLEEKHVSPEKILVLTFTRDAARSMQERFEKSLETSKTVNFGTFHSVFYQILRQSAHLRDSQMLTDGEKRKMLMPLLSSSFPQINFVQRSNLCSDFLAAISLYKNMKDPIKATKFFTEDVKEKFFLVFDQYERERKKEQKLDFDDMLGDCHLLLSKNKAMREFWQNRFSHILIDEFQDSNPAQYEVIKLLAPPPKAVFVVGDDDQSIYGFRGADPDCMKRFEGDYHPKKVILNVNYRSTPAIVKASILVIEENKDRFSKKMMSSLDLKQGRRENKIGNEVRILKFRDRQEEYSFLESSFPKEEECAILFRTNRFMQRFASELEKKKIPYEMREKKQNPYEEEVVQDVMAYLRLAKGEQDLSLWSRIINKPSRYVSREALASCQGLSLSPTEMLERLREYYDGRDDRVLDSLQKLQKQLKTLASLSVFPAVTYIRKVVGYEDYLMELAKNDPARHQENRETLQWLSENSMGFQDLGEWLMFQKNFSDKNKKDEKGMEKKMLEKKSRIHLMTVHGSKGLEFDNVFIPDCNERMYPYGHLLSEREVEEERRLFYVGMTRARKNLYLLYLAGTKDYPEQPSRFLKPIERKSF